MWNIQATDGVAPTPRPPPIQYAEAPAGYSEASHPKVLAEGCYVVDASAGPVRRSTPFRVAADGTITTTGPSKVP